MSKYIQKELIEDLTVYLDGRWEDFPVKVSFIAICGCDIDDTGVHFAWWEDSEEIQVHSTRIKGYRDPTKPMLKAIKEVLHPQNDKLAEIVNSRVNQPLDEATLAGI